MKKTTQNLWDTSKAVLSGKFIVIHIIHSDTQAIFKKQGKSHINWGWCPRQGYPRVFLPIPMSLTTSPDKKIFPGFW